MKIIDKLMSKNQSTKSLKPIFLAHRNDIREALEVGFTRSEIWNQLSIDGVFDGTYFTFCRYVREYINLKSDAPPVTKNMINTEQRKTINKVISNEKKPSPSDWSGKPNKDDLI